MKEMVCLITSIDFLSIQPFLRPLFLCQQELSKLDYYFQNGRKTGAQTNQFFWKLNDIFWWSKISHIIIKGWNYMIKSFSGQVVFCFAILRAISAYVGENWLSQYTYKCAKKILRSLTAASSWGWGHVPPEPPPPPPPPVQHWHCAIIHTVIGLNDRQLFWKANTCIR